MKRLMIAVIAAALVGAFLSPGTALAKNAKVDVCHQAGDGTYHLINISEKAVAKHLQNHGDGLPGDPVPDTFGFELGADCSVQEIDEDGDGFGVLEDCDDGDPDVYPGAPEVADDGIDQNCNGFDLVTYYPDNDGDGFGDGSVPVTDESGSPPSGTVTNGDDCDDTDASVNPGADEVADGIDNDCDGEVDEGLVTEAIFAIAYTNVDGLPGFDEGAGDVLIAKWVDGPVGSPDGVAGAGDVVITNLYPLDVDATGFGTFSLQSHTMDSASALPALGILQGNNPGQQFRFDDTGTLEQYSETAGNAFNDQSNIVDRYAQPGGLDNVGYGAGSPSQPLTPTGFLFQFRGTTDDSFIDVDLFLP